MSLMIVILGFSWGESSTFTEFIDYRIDVNNGIGSLFIKASEDELFTSAGNWNLQPFQNQDLLEHWVRGLPESPAEASFDMTRIL